MITLELGKVRVGFQQYEYLPFWFTNDKTVHITHVNPLVELDEKDLTHAAKEEILTAITFGDLTASEEDYNLLLTESGYALIETDAGVEIIEAPVAAPKKTEPAVDRKTPLVTAPDPDKALRSKAEKYLRLQTTSFNTILGSGTSIQPGITDLALLDLMLEIEKAKPKAKKTYIQAIENRLKIVQEEGFVVTEKKYATIKIENDTISTLEILE